MLVPAHGMHHVVGVRQSVRAWCWPLAVTSEPCKRVFSFYAKGAKDGDSVIVSYDYLIKRREPIREPIHLDDGMETLPGCG